MTEQTDKTTNRLDTPKPPMPGKDYSNYWFAAIAGTMVAGIILTDAALKAFAPQPLEEACNVQVDPKAKPCLPSDLMPN